MSQSDKGSWSFAESDRERQVTAPSVRRRAGLVMAVMFVAVLLAVGSFVMLNAEPAADKVVADSNPRFVKSGKLVSWWDEIPEETLAASTNSALPSNIHPEDYAGPESCRECHQENYESWSAHPHRWMNAYANETSVKGDFSGSASMDYFGGHTEFYKQDGKYRMQLYRDNIRRVYDITQTIGSRFQQYYIGKLIEGPEPPGHEFYSVDHVLPFGYWLDEEEWVPVVHSHYSQSYGELMDEDELPSAQRPDPFAAPHDAFPFTPYHSCNQCHTTFPLADLLTNYPDVVGRHAPVKMHFSVSNYMADTHPESWNPSRPPSEISNEEMMQRRQLQLRWEAPEYAVNLGISCEACHMGSKAHSLAKSEMPQFFPSSPHLHVDASSEVDHHTRNAVNVNWMCGRCHTGNRPQLAAGMATWNSTEYTDAMRGSCYTELTCINCHNPHEAIGSKWPLSPLEDDQLCIKCHQQFESPEAVLKHTHHKTDSSGARCMNCHMPRLNEGLQDVVRTHMIFSPTNRDMIESNQPNACNLCHTDQSIDWTLKYLKDWYDKSYSEEEIAANYDDRQQEAALGWLESENSAVRLLASDALARTNSTWAMDELTDALDDPFLLNRQFARKAIERMLNIRLEDYGYVFYMTAQERYKPIMRIRSALQELQTSASAGSRSEERAETGTE